MTEEKHHCFSCKKEIDISVVPSTTCSGCKELFCAFFGEKGCFFSHKKTTKCNGYAQTILNPSWIINLKKELND